ncbi:MAG: DUF4080 domain-containing protein [Desulfobulbaceae bacterium]|nr:DUF4080 domain-containing protein [Desulfobulbaceae bacterium]
MTEIILTTLNARYIHASIGLRYLYANLKELRDAAEIQEYCVSDHVVEIAEKILAGQPKIIGISVYIWNAVEVRKLIQVIKKVSPKTVVVLGGHEVSHFPLRVDFSEADYIIQGEGEGAFYTLCKIILDGNFPLEKIIPSVGVDVDELEMPYEYYTEEDIENRIIYVEASRGCPFSCEFCLSSIDKTVRYFNIDRFLDQLEGLWKRGARKIKFIDRTFNLNLKVVDRILDYFLAKEPPYLVHFEVIPDHFTESLKEKISRFKPGVLQLEVGIQTLFPETAENISRRLNYEKIVENITFLENETHAHLHVDLIIGLPGEPVDRFGENLNVLTTLTTSEIQLGVLKKLSGTAISRHESTYGLVFSDFPPYDILQNDLIPFWLMQDMKRFSRFWDLVYNSGNLNKSVQLIWHDTDVFSGFLAFSRWLYGETRSTWRISLNRLAELVFIFLVETKKVDRVKAANAIAADLLKVRGRTLPARIREHATYIPAQPCNKHGSLGKRQIKYL